ncbi:MAG: hypothetical protein Q7R96_05700 [Nanoarchaeota archaeon]|nr:hypothetical protein [Nanoarchaeota archaeon]
MKATRDWIRTLLREQPNISCRDLRPKSIAVLTSQQLSNLPFGGIQ